MDVGDVVRPPAELVEGFRTLSTGTISNALDKLGIAGSMRNIKPVSPGFRVLGGAVTVWELTGDRGSFAPEELGLGSLIDMATQGDVIVIDNGGAPVSTWGGVAAFAAKSKGLAGVVVDGAVRDVDQIREFEFPVFSRHVVPVTGKTRIKMLAVNRPIRVDGISVRPGDIIVGDGSGVMRVPIEIAAEILELARKQDAADEQVIEWVRRGLPFSEALQRAGVR